jgi:Prolyl oligopeptidase family
MTLHTDGIKLRRFLVVSLIHLVCVFTAYGQSPHDLLRTPILSESERHSMMYSFVDRNLGPIELPSTLAAWEQRKPRLRDQIRQIVGLEDLDERGPLKWISKGFINRQDYTIEKIIYESYAGMMVPALVYTPSGLTAPAPAMVSVPGHAYCEGKANVEAQARSVNLVRRGLIVMTYDYLMTFERNTGPNPCALMPYGGGNDHGLTGFSYTAGTPTALEIRDGIRAIDYLYTRKDVDRSRVGFTGESGGGNSTYWIAALDDRIRLAAPVCAVTSFDYWIRNNRNWDWHQRPPGIRNVADISTLLALIAPRHLLVITALRGTDSEEVPFDEAEGAVRQARKIYDLYGSGANIQHWESNSSHGYQQDKRERMYGWIERHFLGRKVELSAERSFLFEPRTELICGLPPGNRTFADIYQEWLSHPARAPALPQDQTSAAQIQDSLRTRLRSLLGIPGRGQRPILSVQKVSSNSETITKQLIFETEQGIRLPAVEFSLTGAESKAIVIFLGKSSEFLPALPEMISRGLRIVFVDLRGVGEIDSGGRRTDNWAWLMGRPWPGLWVEDTDKVVTALTIEYGNVPVGLVGAGRLAKSALFAAALDPRITALVSRLPEVSYRQEARKGYLADVPKVLSVLDLPTAVALVAPRPCWIQVQDGVDEQELQSTYAWSSRFYESSWEAPGALRLSRADPSGWKLTAEWLANQLEVKQR